MKNTLDQSAPSFAEAQAAFTRIGLLSFGGPAAQIALMHRVIVDEKKWLSERAYRGDRTLFPHRAHRH